MTKRTREYFKRGQRGNTKLPKVKASFANIRKWRKTVRYRAIWTGGQPSELNFLSRTYHKKEGINEIDAYGDCTYQKYHSS